jgi:hypothetical protein
MASHVAQSSPAATTQSNVATPAMLLSCARVGTPFSAFWLRSSVVSVHISLIADTGSNGSLRFNLFFLVSAPYTVLARWQSQHATGLTHPARSVQPPHSPTARVDAPIAVLASPLYTPFDHDVASQQWYSRQFDRSTGASCTGTATFSDLAMLWCTAIDSKVPQLICLGEKKALPILSFSRLHLEQRCHTAEMQRPTDATHCTRLTGSLGCIASRPRVW